MIADVQTRTRPALATSSLVALSRMLAAGTVTSRELVEECLANAAAPATRVAFTTLHATRARADSDRVDRMRRDGAPMPPFAGIPISIKDLFDEKGEVTTAGSRMLAGTAPALQDATTVARLKAAGFVVIGRTNLSEFAYNALGLNPYYGDPLSPYDRDSRRVAGGSSSGCAVSVADAAACISLGSDTGASIRIPAAFCGLVGFAPTPHRIPRDGVFALSPSLDSLGPLGRTVSCCAVFDDILNGAAGMDVQRPAASSIRIGLPGGEVLRNLDEEVSRAYEKALRRLADAGFHLSEMHVPEIADTEAVNADRGGLVGFEAFSIHRERIAQDRSRYDPNIVCRLETSSTLTQADYDRLLQERRALKQRIKRTMAGFDALLLPTVPIVPPLRSAVEDPSDFRRVNSLVLQNTLFTNFLDLCSVTIPCHEAGDAPVGLMMVGAENEDRTLLAMAAAVERVIAPDDLQYDT